MRISLRILRIIRVLQYAVIVVGKALLRRLLGRANRTSKEHHAQAPESSPSPACLATLQLERFTACLDQQGQPVLLGSGAFADTWQYED
jgi:hypothetical protein